MDVETIQKRLKEIEQSPLYGSPKHREDCDWMIKIIKSLLKIVEKEQ